MNNYDLDKIKDTFSRLFVIAIDNKMNLLSFTTNLEQSFFVKRIERKELLNCINLPMEELFFRITGFHILDDTSFGVYNDAYWAGDRYFKLYLKLKKSFSYLFLKFPLEKMLECYKVYHEMDFSSLLEYFMEEEKKKTILRLLCINKHCSLTDLSKATNIPLNTLKRYNLNDEYLYNGSFKYVIKIKEYFDVSTSLFINE